MGTFFMAHYVLNPCTEQSIKKLTVTKQQN